MNRMGWHWWPGSNAIPILTVWRSESMRTPRHLPYRLPRRCEINTRHDPLAAAIKAGARLITGARVRENHTNDQGLATGAVYIDLNGREPAAEGLDRHPVRQRRRHATPIAALGKLASQRIGQFQ